MNSPDPRSQPGPTLNDKIQLETVNHKARTAILFGVVAGALLALAMYFSLR